MYGNTTPTGLLIELNQRAKIYSTKSYFNLILTMQTYKELILQPIDFSILAKFGEKYVFSMSWASLYFMHCMSTECNRFLYSQDLACVESQKISFKVSFKLKSKGLLL